MDLIYVDLTDSQIEKLEPLFKQVNHAADQGEKGLILAQVKKNSTGGNIRAKFIPYIYTEKIIPIIREMEALKEVNQMTLRQKQSKFVRMVALLIQLAHEKGYELTFGDAYATSGHKENSLHYSRLAIDLNLFKDGQYLSSTEDHNELGVFWESIGGSWGGRFDDGNHYSLEHNGYR
jgi:hypothetical protein